MKLAFFKVERQLVKAESQFEKDRNILLLSFEDPDTRNSFSLRAAVELSQILDQIESASASAASPSNLPKISGLIFRGRGRVFCSGGNLADYAGLQDPEQGKKINREITAVLDRLSRLSVPTICCVEGDCFGGGLELISAFDWVVSKPGVVFGFWQRRIGLSFGWGGGLRLARRLGAQRLIQNAVAAREVFTDEARQIHLVDAIRLSDQLLPAALQKMIEFNRFSQLPISSFKTLQNDLSAKTESAIFEALWWNQDHQKALAPFR